MRMWTLQHRWQAVEALRGFVLELAWAGTLCKHLLHCPFPFPPTGPSSTRKGAQLPRMTCIDGWDEENCIQAKRKKMTAVCPCYFQGHSKSCLCCFNFWLVFLEAALLPLEKMATAKMKHWATAAPVPKMYLRSGWLAFYYPESTGAWGDKPGALNACSPSTFIYGSMGKDFFRGVFCADFCTCDVADHRSTRSIFAGANNCNTIQKYTAMCTAGVIK